jgi:hypothetical protein
MPSSQEGTQVGLGVCYFLERSNSKTELIIILKMSETDRLILCTAFSDTTLAATRLLHSIKSFLQLLHLLHGLKSNITNSSCLFSKFGNMITSISSLPTKSQQMKCHCMYICNLPFPDASCYNTVAICFCVGLMLNSCIQNHF